MITASGSSRLTAEATPVPSASIARSISFSARSSPWSSARSQMPLVSRGFSCLSISLKRSVLCALFVLAARLGFHRRAPGVGLHAALAPAGALGAAALDDHVADLAGGAAAEPRLAVEDQAAADAGAPEDAEQGRELARRRRAGTRLRSRPGRRCRCGPRSRGRLASVRASGKLPSQPGRFRAAGDDAGLLVGVAGRADPDPARSAGSTLGGGGRLAQRGRHRRRRRRRGRRWSASGGVLRRAPCRRRRRSRSGSSSRRGLCLLAVPPRTESLFARQSGKLAAMSRQTGWRLWWAKRRWYERNRRPLRRLRIARHAARGGFFVRYAGRGRAARGARRGPADDRRRHPARAGVLADPRPRGAGSRSAPAASSTATRCSPRSS